MQLCETKANSFVNTYYGLVFLALVMSDSGDTISGVPREDDGTVVYFTETKTYLCAVRTEKPMVPGGKLQGNFPATCRRGRVIIEILPPR